VTVTYRTHDVTAVEWRDYSPALDTVTFQPGETTKTFQDVTWRDREAEPDETFVVELSDPVNATIADGSATGTILANTSTP
jgi:hypothetical protein